MTDHDAIAARVRQNRETGTPGPWKIGKNNPARVSREGRYIANFDPLHSNDPKCEDDARRAARLPDLEAAYLDLYDEVKRLLAALDDIAAAAFWIANDIHIGPEDEGRDIYEMALAIRDDARAALKGDSDE
jgi:hypothetical protein